MIELAALIIIGLAFLILAGVLVYYIKMTDALLRHLVKAVKSRDIHEMMSADKIAEEYERAETETVDTFNEPLEDVSNEKFMETIRKINEENLQDIDEQVESE